MVKILPANTGDAGDVSLIPGSGRSPGGGIGNPFQYSCLEKCHGQTSLAGYNPCGRKELDTTEHKNTNKLTSFYTVKNNSVAQSCSTPCDPMDCSTPGFLVHHQPSPKSSHPRPLPQNPKDCSMHLCLFCCLAYRVIVTIFLNSIYICVLVYCIGVFLSGLLHCI